MLAPATVSSGAFIITNYPCPAFPGIFLPVPVSYRPGLSVNAGFLYGIPYGGPVCLAFILFAEPYLFNLHYR